MIQKLWNVCVSVMIKKNMIGYFLADFGMEIVIRVQTAMALPVFLNLMLNAYEEGNSSLMIWYALIWFVLGVIFVCVRYYSDIFINGKFFYRTITEVRDRCFKKIYDNENIQVSADYNANPYYTFLSNSTTDFTQILFRMDRWLADVVVILGFMVWSMQMSVSISLIAFIGAFVSIIVGNYISTKVNQINKKIFDQKAEMFGALHNLFWGTESFLIKGKYCEIEQKYEESVETYNKNNEKFSKKKAIRDNVIGGIDCVTYVFIILRCVFFPGVNSLAIVITMISSYQVLKGYLNRLNSLSMMIMEKYYVIEKYYEIMQGEFVKDKETETVEFQKAEKMIEIRNLCYSTEKTEILKNISMDIFMNQKVALIGENGSGKSTLLKNILRVIKPTSGEIRIKEGVKYSYIPVNAQLFPVSIYENVRYGMINENREILELSIQVAQLGHVTNIDLEKELVDGDENLSGGEAQRVAIARGLAASYDLLVADEPTANLDIQTEDRVIQELLKHANTLLYTTHNPLLVKYADMVYIMERGRIAAQGTFEEISNLPIYKNWKKNVQEQR